MIIASAKRLAFKQSSTAASTLPNSRACVISPSVSINKNKTAITENQRESFLSNLPSPVLILKGCADLDEDIESNMSVWFW